MASDGKRIPAHAIPRQPFKLVVDLPMSYYQGIGQIVQAHSILEDRVSMLLFKLMKVDEAIGRSALGYKSAHERFKTIRLLIELHGIQVLTPLTALENQILDCCNLRDQFAHGIWIANETGKIAIRLARGILEAEEGKIDRRFAPE